MRRPSLRALALCLGLALGQPAFGLAGADPVDPVGGLSRQIDRLAYLLRDGEAHEVNEARKVAYARARDGSPVALVILTLEKYRGANNKGEFLAVFLGRKHAGEKAWTTYYRLLGVAKLAEDGSPMVAGVSLAGQERGELVVRVDFLERQPGGPPGVPSRRSSKECRFKQELLYWGGEAMYDIR